MKIPKIQPAPGRSDSWILIEPWWFYHQDVSRVIPVGYKFDLASIPKILRSFVQKADRRTWGPALEHDFRYQYHIGPRKRADQAFHQALRINGVSPFKAYIMYLAVRIGGYSGWNRG